MKIAVITTFNEFMPSLLSHPELSDCRRLFLRNYNIMSNIGVHDFEKVSEQRVLFNVELFIPLLNSTPTQDELIRRIETMEKEIEDWQLLRDYLIQFVPQVIFPKFKRDRGRLYFKFLINFAENQAMNSEKNVEIWTSILDNCA